MSNAPGMRASDAEREQAAQALREHYAAGRELTHRDRQPGRRPVSGPRWRELR
jgi:hypothetical protein